MKIGIFTDTYFPQISGVATSIKTLKEQLEAQNHKVYIFTTTDPLLPNATKVKEPDNIIRLRSVPFISMPERRFVMVGLNAALRIARKYDLDIIHTQTEFGVGILGKVVARRLDIPVVHTVHTKYEDYLHYIANGKLIKPGAVKYLFRSFLFGTEGIICPSPMTADQVRSYGIKTPLAVIPTGIVLEKFQRPDITPEMDAELRDKLGVKPEETMLLSVSRLSFEKNIQAVIQALPTVLRQRPVHLVIVGHGPYRDNLKKLVKDLSLQNNVTFVGPVANHEVVNYYKAADFLISASTSETQGLTFPEALAAGTPIIGHDNPYLESLVTDPMFGRLFSNERELAQVILNAITHPAPMDPERYQVKAHEISVEHLVNQVAEFYQYIIEQYQPRTSKTRFNLGKWIRQRRRNKKLDSPSAVSSAE